MTTWVIWWLYGWGVLLILGGLLAIEGKELPNRWDLLIAFLWPVSFPAILLVRAAQRVVRANAERLPPWELFRMKTTGDRVTVYSYAENGAVTVNLTAEFNLTLFERQVFGVNPADLEPCDLPAEDEIVGTVLTGEQVAGNIDTLRILLRPDLFTMGPNGKAVRKNN